MQTFHQLFDETSSTFTYLLIDADTRQALLIDPVDRQYARDVAVLEIDGIGRLTVNVVDPLHRVWPREVDQAIAAKVRQSLAAQTSSASS